MRTKIIKSKYFDYYNKNQPITLLKHFNKLKELNFDNKKFGYYVSGASVYSSMIEGNKIDFDTFLKYSETGMNTKSKSYKEIKDLISAYEYAKNKKLNLKNFLSSHKILSETILDERKYKGLIRDKEVYIYNGGIKIYTGASKDIVKEEFTNLFNDIEILINRDLSISEVFYFASMLHFVFAHIHPFADGNGRSARLLEKWFLAEKLGLKAWFIQSEKMYHKRIKSYYKNLNIGNEYNNLNYDLCIPFLKMLPMSFTSK